ncbi:MAG: hypothetical protein IT425_15570 [Pirellulales bacterium]|nr:hypothetical protein [Pirellulales bacterium]
MILIVGLFVAVPFLRGKRDLLTAWNSLLLGIVLFAGVTSIETKYVYALAPWKHLGWFQPTAEEISWYMTATACFIAVLIGAYYLNTLANRFAQNRFRKWPEVTASGTFFILICCGLVMLSSIALSKITFLGPLTFNLALAAAPAACVFSFRMWYHNRTNFGWLTLFVTILIGAALYAMVVSGGRRLLLSVILGPVLYVYWSDARYWKRSTTIFAVGLAVVFVFIVSAVYANFRYNLQGKERTAGNIVTQIQGVRESGSWFKFFLSQPLQYFGQGTGQFALLTQRFVSDGVLTPIPLNSLRFIFTYPIPRNVWKGKPEVLGVRVTRDAAGAPGTNWGLGVAGQGAFEGGIPALILYAVLLAFGARIMDEPMRLQPGNPFLIYMHAAALPHVVAIPRGDMGGMVIQAAQCVLFAYLLGFVYRQVFGIQRSASVVAANGPPSGDVAGFASQPTRRSHYY